MKDSIPAHTALERRRGGRLIVSLLVATVRSLSVAATHDWLVVGAWHQQLVVFV